MKNKFNYQIIIIIVLVIILGVIFYLYYKEDDNTDTNNYNYTTIDDNSDNISFTTTSSVSSALEEEIPLRTGYYLKEVLVTDNVVIKKGAKIIKYTNGKYLTAPYDLIITKFNVPDTTKICNNTHNITVAAFNVLSAEFRVSESKMDSVYIGKEVKIKVPALNDREIEGIITDISSTATNGKFTATIEFDNDGDIKLGMTINITIYKNRQIYGDFFMYLL